MSVPDNDHLSALVATAIQADLLILLSDVDGELSSVCTETVVVMIHYVTGIYTGHPSESKSRLIRTYYPEHELQVSFWGKSRVGLGGMENKVRANHEPCIC